MTSATRNRAIRYAEDELGVHTCFQKAVETEQALKSLLPKRAAAEGLIRHLDVELDGQRMRIREDLRNTADAEKLSATAFESKYKDIVGSDLTMHDLTTELGKAKDDLANLDVEIRSLDLEHRTAIARMNELGGYFAYLASARNANTAARTQSQDWPW